MFIIWDIYVLENNYNLLLAAFDNNNFENVLYL